MNFSPAKQVAAPARASTRAGGDGESFHERQAFAICAAEPGCAGDGSSGTGVSSVSSGSHERAARATTRFTDSNEPNRTTAPGDSSSAETIQSGGAHLHHRREGPAGRALYQLRQQTVEPAFGIIESVLGFRQLRLRGLPK